MQFKSRGFCKQLRLGIAGLSVLNGAALFAATNSIKNHGEEEFASLKDVAVSTVHKAGEQISRAGQNIAHAVSNQGRVDSSWKGSVGIPACRAIRAQHFGDRSYGFWELAAAPVFCDFSQDNWAQENTTIVKNARLGLRPSTALGFRHLIGSNAFWGLHASFDTAPVFDTSAAFKSARLGMHGELGIKNCLFQLNAQRLLTHWNLDTLKNQLTSDVSLNGAKVFAPIYLRCLFPFYKTQQNGIVEFGLSAQNIAPILNSNKQISYEFDKSKEHFYAEFNWLPKFYSFKVLKTLFKYADFVVGARAIHIKSLCLQSQDNQDLSLLQKIGQRTRILIQPVLRFSLRLSGTAQTAEKNIGRFLALNYYQNCCLPDRNFSGQQHAQWYSDAWSIATSAYYKSAVFAKRAASKIKTPSAVDHAEKS